MKFEQNWQLSCANKIDNKFEEFINIKVPCTAQYEWGKAHGFGDVNYAENARNYSLLEDKIWLYRTRLNFAKDKKTFFVAEGIDYSYIIKLNGKTICQDEGMFSQIKIDITDLAQPGDVLDVYILEPPKRTGAKKDTRAEADQSCKPAVCYGWDWHPRLIVSGIWKDAYVLTTSNNYLSECEVFYKLADDFSSCEITFQSDKTEDVIYALFDAEGKQVYYSKEPKFILNKPKLWWCNGEGEQYLYRYFAINGNTEITGEVGFRKITLVNTLGSRNHHLGDVPITRDSSPFQLILNGRKIFLKGTNWVNPEIFTAEITAKTYKPLISLAKKAHMNIFRCWGGAIVNKKEFFVECDRAGILVWQEFPLACNNYIGSKHYLSVLEKEAISIIKQVRKHCCLCFWCGGNELFNGWSGMDEQSLALRLLNKLCYEYDRDTPFLMTSPLTDVAHGGYIFYYSRLDKDIYEIMNDAKGKYVAYPEAGMPSISSVEYLKTFIPEDELFPISKDGSWRYHFAFFAGDDNEFGREIWFCESVLKKYFGEIKSFEEVVENSQWLQCEGYKAIFEEARRQKPFCGAVLNWCYNEPWKTAANTSIVNYPAIEKPAYFAVKESLRPTLASLKFFKFDYRCGENFECDVWVLNDSIKSYSNVNLNVEVILDNEIIFSEDIIVDKIESQQNKECKKINFLIPKALNTFVLLKISCKEFHEWNSEYKLKLFPC